MAESAVSNLLARLEKVTARLEVVEKQIAQGGVSSSATTGGDDSGGSISVREYEDLINQFIIPFVDISGKLGASEVAEQAALVLQAVNAQRDMLIVAASCKKPSDDVLVKLLQPTSEFMAQITSLRDSKRTSKFFNNLSTVSEGIGALGWVAVSPTPGPHVADMRGGSEFYSNRILKEFKGNNQVQVDWVTAYNTFLKELQAYIKKHHTTGLSWNPRGGDASSSTSTSSSGGAPPPPGPPPPPAVLLPTTEENTGAPDMSNVFASINKGIEVTSGLRKVTSDMKTKNRTDKSSVVPASAIKEKSTTAEKSSKQEASKPPKLALEGSKWLVSYQSGNKNIVISETEPKQVIYIFKCSNSVIQIKGKVNAITIDDSTKTAVVFEQVVSSLDVVNCRSVEVQATGKVPSIAIDKTSGCQIYLSKASLDAEIITSKSSEMNVLIPGASEDQDLIEIPIPEQYKTIVRNDKLITETVHHV